METMTDSFLLLLITVTTKCFYLTFSCNFIEYYVYMFLDAEVLLQVLREVLSPWI